jgi:hypothetical protein
MLHGVFIDKPWLLLVLQFRLRVNRDLIMDVIELPRESHWCHHVNLTHIVGSKHWLLLLIHHHLLVHVTAVAELRLHLLLHHELLVVIVSKLCDTV